MLRAFSHWSRWRVARWFDGSVILAWTMTPRTPALATRLRHRACLQEAADALGRFEAARAGGLELGAEELRAALAALSRLLGTTGAEAVLDAVFSEFCVGK